MNDSLYTGLGFMREHRADDTGEMVAGDEEYRDPNKLLRTVIATIVVAVLILSFGTYFLVRV